MKKYLHNSDASFDSPEYGWEQMQFLLEKNLPQNRNPKRVPLLTIFVAASCISILLLSSLVIKNLSYTVSFEKYAPAAGNTTGTVAEVPGNPVPVANTAATMQSLFAVPDVKQAMPPAPAVAGRVHYGETAAMPAYPHLTALPLLKPARQPEDIMVRLLEDNKERSITTALAADITDSAHTAANSSPGKKNKQPRKASWNMYAGLAVNGVMGEKQNLRPYPVATLQYNITDRLYVSLGLAAGSPVAASSKGIDKTVFLNDTTNNVNFYNNVKYYSRLTYADIPLLAGVRVNKKLSLQAGVQASVLLNTKTSTSIDRYDFQLSMSSGLPASIDAGVRAVSEENYQLEARKIDYRFTGGVRYDLKNAHINLQYQYAPQPAVSGEKVSGKNNRLISLGVQLKIK